MSDLPVDSTAERHLIGSVWSGLALLDPEARAVLFEVPAEAFFIRDHAMVWDGIRSLVSSGSPLGELPLAWQVGGGRADEALRQSVIETLSSGADLSPVPLRDRVMEFYQRRTAIQAAHAVIASASDLTLPPEDVEAKANESFLRVARGVGSAPSRFWNGLDLMDRVEHGEPLRPRDARDKLLHFGLPWLDDLLITCPGNVIVMAGRPGAGKTGLGLQARNVTASRGVPSAFMSLEMGKEELDARDLAWWCSDPRVGRIISFRDLLAGRYNASEAMAALRDQIPALQNTYGWAHSSGLPTGKLIGAMAEAVEVYGCRSLVIDYFQYIGTSRQKGDTLASAYGANSIAIKKFAQDYRVSVLVLSQLNRETENRTRPVMADLKETSQLEQDAQAIPMLYRDKEGNLMVTLPKNRDGETVQERGIDVCWPCLRFTAPDRQTEPGLVY